MLFQLGHLDIAADLVLKNNDVFAWRVQHHEMVNEVDGGSAAIIARAERGGGVGGDRK